MVIRISSLQLFCIFLMSICAWQSCATSKITGGLEAFFTESGPFKNHFVGFALFDPDEEKWLFKHQADKYFTPASNTKVLTLYASLHYLGDSLVGAASYDSQDTLFVWGMGDPTFLHSEFPSQYSLIQKINQHPSQHVVFCLDHFKDLRFGSGWAWDDYFYGYQLEKSALPMFANRVKIHLDSATQSVSYTPPTISIKHLTSDHFAIDRGEHDNQFRIQWPSTSWPSRVYHLPLHRSSSDVISLLQPLTSKIIKVQKQCRPLTIQQLILTTPLDTVYRKLMHSSDNFIAEQLLLQISALELGEMQTKKIIDHIKQEIMSEVSDQLLWYDGSGLSRYNMFTPTAVVHILNKIKSMTSSENLRDIFPAGGQSGTIKSFYASDPPFVYAKTGTLRNKHCLSGFLITDQGKTLIFSFMHNNFPGPSFDTKPAMDKVLRFIKNKY